MGLGRKMGWGGRGLGEGDGLGKRDGIGEGGNSCASLAELVSFIACFILLVIAPLFKFGEKYCVNVSGRMHKQNKNIMPLAPLHWAEA